MPKIKYYAIEKQIYAKYNKLVVSNTDAKKICRKLARHFKFQIKAIKFKGKRGINYSYAYTESRRLRLVNEPSILTIAHESAHLFCSQKWYEKRKSHHKRLLKAVGKFLKYMESKNFWNIAKVIL